MRSILCNQPYPVVLVQQIPLDIEQNMLSLAAASGSPMLTGFCCANIDDTVSEKQISAIFETAQKLRKEADHE